MFQIPRATTLLQGSPAKLRIRLDDHGDTTGKFYHNSDSIDVTRALPDLIWSFPDTNQSVSETTLKDMPI